MSTPFNLREWPGYSGVFTRDQAPAALANNTRVVKVSGDAGDTHAIGERATVLGSISEPRVGVGYFVEWDAHPNKAVFVVASKIEPIRTSGEPS